MQLKENLTMKKSFIIFVSFMALFVWLMPAFVSAQQEGVEKLRQLMENTTPEQRAHFQDRWMKKDLNLSRDQAAKVGKINLRTAKQMQSIYQTNEGRFRKFRQIMSARDAKDSELQNVLTGAQFSKYQAKKEEMWQKMHNMHKMK
jgi:hypothetical protein